jgi:hypothetical protein
MAAANRKIGGYPSALTMTPAIGPEIPKDRSTNAVYTPKAEPRSCAGTFRTASAPRAGNTSEKPKPVSAAPAWVTAGTEASQSKMSPEHSHANETVATRYPPHLLMVFANNSRAATNETPKRLSESPACGQ